MFASLFAFRRAEKAGFRHAPITVQNGPFLARTQNTKIGPRDKPLQEELTVVDAFLRLKRWAIVVGPSGTGPQSCIGIDTTAQQENQCPSPVSAQRGYFFVSYPPSLALAVFGLLSGIPPGKLLPVTQEAQVRGLSDPAMNPEIFFHESSVCRYGLQQVWTL